MSEDLGPDISPEQFREMCRKASREAVMVAVDIMRTSTSDSVRLKAVEFIAKSANFDKAAANSLLNQDEFAEMPRRERIKMLQEALEVEQTEEAQSLLATMEVTA